MRDFRASRASTFAAACAGACANAVGGGPTWSQACIGLRPAPSRGAAGRPISPDDGAAFDRDSLRCPAASVDSAPRLPFRPAISPGFGRRGSLRRPALPGAPRGAATARSSAPPAARPRLGRAAATTLVWALAAVLPACAGWKGDTYHAHRFPPKLARKEATYRFGDPGPGWQPVRNIEDVQVAWTKRDIGGAIEIHAQCDQQGDSALHEYTDHLRIDWTGWEVESQEEARLVDRAALHTVVTADLDGIVRRNEFWVVKKNGCLFDLRYSASPHQFEQGRPAFARVVEGFRFPLRGDAGRGDDGGAQ
jgi:hypothetical protein